MSVSTHTYIGPYFEITSPKNPERTDLCKDKGNCPDKSGAESKRAIPNSWCATCGIKLCDRFKTSAHRPGFHEIFEELFDDVDRFTHCLNNTGDGPSDDSDDTFVDCLIPNLVSSSLPRDFHAKSSHEIDEGDRGTELIWLRRRYKDEHIALKEKFGDANVRVCWGFMIWWS